MKNVSIQKLKDLPVRVYGSESDFELGTPVECLYWILDAREELMSDRW